MNYREVNFDGLIGPTHNYSGLAYGNLASAKNAKRTSNPKKAALQGLAKMRLLLELGYQQGFFIPQQRPDLQLLRRLGFTGTDTTVLDKVARQQPQLLSRVYSASAMWAANAATVSPSCDSEDGRVHFTPANLISTGHRAIEADATFACLNTIFNDQQFFKIHRPLPAQASFADEGAANHMRLSNSYSDLGSHIYVYGRDGFNQQQQSSHFPARQTRAAAQAIARQHKLAVDQVCLVQQNSVAIDAGAFHNDVIAVSNGPVLFHHQQAFAFDVIESFKNHAYVNTQVITVTEAEVNLSAAIGSYLFNSQLLASTTGDMSSMRLIAPTQALQNNQVTVYLNKLLDDHQQPIRHIDYVDVRESMSNGGGPACLRLRVILNEQELAAVNQKFILDFARLEQLETWVSRYYRDHLCHADLGDPLLLIEALEALQALTDLLHLGNYYPFQQA